VTLGLAVAVEQRRACLHCVLTCSLFSREALPFVAKEKNCNTAAALECNDLQSHLEVISGIIGGPTGAVGKYVDGLLKNRCLAQRGLQYTQRAQADQEFCAKSVPSQKGQSGPDAPPPIALVSRPTTALASTSGLPQGASLPHDGRRDP
jgi:hypothetical protein